MASLAAVISDDPRVAVPPEELTKLLDALRDLRGRGPVRRMAAGGWAEAALIDGDVPGDSGATEDGWHLVVGTPAMSVPLWQARLSDLDGAFAVVRHQVRADAVEVLTDPFGVQAFYCARRAGLVYVSTSATALARHLAAAPDPVGNALFVRTGVQYGPVTHWAGVERIEPGTVMRFGHGGTRVTTYWQPTVDESVSRLSLAATVDRLVDAGLEAVGPLLHEPCVAADLTGGFDTRLVSAFLLARGVKFSTHTSGEEDDLDVQLARQVAAAAGVPWRREAIPAGWTLDPALLAAAVAWGDGTLDALQLGEVLHRQAERSQTCGLVVAGVGGEHLSPFPWLQEFLRAGRTKTIDWDALVRMRLLLPVDLSMFRTDPSPVAEQYGREVLGRRASQYAAELNTTKHDALYAYRIPSHSGAYRSAGEGRIRVQAPCHTKRFFTVGFSANYRYRNGSRLHRGVIERLSPTIAALPTQRGGPATLTRSGNLLTFAPYYTRLVRSAVRKVRGISGKGHLLSPAAAEGYRAAVARLREDGRLTASTMRTGDLYDPLRLDALVSESASPSFSGWSMLGRILTLELALTAADPSVPVTPGRAPSAAPESASSDPFAGAPARAGW